MNKAAAMLLVMLERLSLTRIIGDIETYSDSARVTVRIGKEAYRITLEEVHHETA